MKIRISIIRVLFILIFAYPLRIYSQQKEGFTVDGYMEGLKEGEKVSLQCMSRTILTYKVNDSAFVKNGKFHIEGIAPGGARYYWMAFDKHPRKAIRLFISNKDNVFIHSTDIEKIPHDFLDNYVKIEGSKTTMAFYKFLYAQQIYVQSMVKLNLILQKITDSIGFDPGSIGTVIDAEKAVNEALYVCQFYRMDTAIQPVSVLPFLVRSSNFAGFSFRSPYLLDIYNSLDENTKNSFEGKILKESAMLSIGQPFPSFDLPTTDGKMISSDDVIKKSKATIVQFWAVSSPDRDKFQAELRMMYKNYHDKGLNIIGISSDDSSTEYNYKRMVREQAFPWSNVCDLQGRNGVVETVYHEFSAFPASPVHNTTNVLVGSDGKIIAWDIDGVELQWYLWSIFQNKKDLNN